MRRLLAIALILLIATPPAVGQSVTGAGSTFAHPILARWGQVYASLRGEGGDIATAESGFDYEPVGSTGGVARVLARAVDFAASDVPAPPEELDRHGLVQFPFVTGGVAIVVNLPGLGEAPRLTADAVAHIYLGEITRWSDSALVELNPDLRLPDTSITVLRRSDGSGTTFAFSRWLARGHAPWKERVGTGAVLRWPVGRGVARNRDLALAVRATPHAIAYVEAGQAERSGLTAALLRNASGSFVGPTARAITHGTETTDWAPGRHFFRDAEESAHPDAYPIVATVYALMPRQPASSARARRTLEFFRLGLTERAMDAAALGYVPLPPEAVAQVVQYWRATIRGAR